MSSATAQDFEFLHAPLQGVGAGPHRALKLFIGPLHLPGEVAQLCCACQPSHEQLAVNGLGNKRIGAGIQRFDGEVVIVVPRDQERGCHGSDRFRGRDEIEPRHAGHVHIADDNIEIHGGNALEGRVGGQACLDGRARNATVDELFERQEQRGIVIDDETGEARFDALPSRDGWKDVTRLFRHRA
jgi:hypothetical protein